MILAKLQTKITLNSQVQMQWSRKYPDKSEERSGKFKQSDLNSIRAIVEPRRDKQFSPRDQDRLERINYQFSVEKINKKRDKDNQIPNFPKIQGRIKRPSTKKVHNGTPILAHGKSSANIDLSQPQDTKRHSFWTAEHNQQHREHEPSHKSKSMYADLLQHSLWFLW